MAVDRFPTGAPARSDAPVALPLPPPATLERLEHAAQLAVGALARSHATRRGRHGLAAILRVWRERHFAACVCRDMLRLHAEVAAAHPGLHGRALYREIVAAHHGGCPRVADALLDRARQSFAEWPVVRALDFRDVVHYLVVLEFIAANRNVRWIHVDMKRLVSDAIPRGL